MEAPTPRLKEKYENEVVPALMQRFEYKNVMEVPKVEKVIVNMENRGPGNIPSRLLHDLVLHVSYHERLCDAYLLEQGRHALRAWLGKRNSVNYIYCIFLSPG